MNNLKLHVFNQYGRLGFPYRQALNKIADEFALRFKLNISASVILVDEEEIKNLNVQFRLINQATDVLSFPSDEDDYLGEIFICIPYLKKQAIEINNSYIREFSFLLIHGLLHLLSYDHNNQAEEKVMFDLQKDILNKLDIK